MSDPNPTRSDAPDQSATASGADPAATQAGPGERISVLDAPSLADVPRSQAAGDRYELGEEIARGGMGAVYRATDTVLNREVAVKVLQTKYAPTSGSARRFADEARITAQLQHPNIPAVHDLGTLPDGRPFLAMKLIKGQTLDDLLKSRSGPAGDRGRFVAVFEAICQGVAYAHAHEVIHRDLKPANVMVGNFGEVQVMDWGLAKVLGTHAADTDPESTSAETEIKSMRDSEDFLTQAGSVLGTPAYMPPEQALGAVHEVDARSDVFGLGGILAAALTGRPPFVSETAETTRVMAAKGKVGDCFARLDASRADPELVALCKRCLAPEKDDRPANAGEVALAVAALRAAADERARQADVERERAAVREAEQRKRRRALQLAAAAVAAVLLAGVVGTTWGLLRAEDKRRDAEAALEDKGRALEETEAARRAEAAAKTAALQARSTADAVNKFLIQDMLAAAAPDRALGRTVTVQDALDAAAKQVETAFPDQPAVEAAVRASLGSSYLKLGKPTKATPHLRKAYDWYRRDLGPAATETLKAGQALAVSLDDASDYTAAEALWDELAATATARYGGEADLTLDIASGRGLSLQTHNKGDRALKVLLETLATRQRLGSDPEKVHKLENDLGVIYYFRGNYAEAERVTRQALAGRTKLHDHVHPSVLESRNNLAAIMEAKGQTEAAIDLLERLVEESTRVRGPNHVDTLSNISNLGRAYYKAKLYRLAQENYALAVERALASPDLGPDHPLTLTFRQNLSNAFFSNKDTDQAIDTCRDVVERRKRLLELHHPDTLTAELDLGRMLVFKQQYAAAVDPLRSNLAGRAAVQKLTAEEAVTAGTVLLRAASAASVSPAVRDDIVTMVAAVWLAHKSAGKPPSPSALRLAAALAAFEVRDPKRVPAAEARYAEVYAAQKELPAAERYTAATDYVRFLTGLGKYDEAMTVGQEMIRFADDLPERERPAKRRFAWLVTGDAAVKAGNPDVADPLYERAYEYHRDTDPDPVELISCRYKLGQSKRMLKKYAESETFLLACHDGLQKSDRIDAASKKLRTTLAIQELVQLYTDWEKPEKAAEWKTKLPAATPRKE